MKISMIMKLDNINYKKTAVISAATMMGGIIFGYLLFPIILKAMLRHVSMCSVWDKKM
jgi:hypothetical protein